MIKKDILEYQIENKSGNITTNQLKKILDKYFEGVPEEDKLQEKLTETNFKLKSKPEYGGQEIEIPNIYDGGLTEKTEGKPATASEVNAVIGQTVDYKDKSDGKVEDWRVFYASDTELFLISSNTIASTTAFGGDTGIPLKAKAGTDYAGAENVFATKYGEKYNAMWKKVLENDTSNHNDNEKATAYLCDPNNWTEYVGDNAPAGTYAVGGPTKELFIESLNASIPQTIVEKVSLVDEDVTVGGYAYKKPSYSLNKNDDLYKNGHEYWLASPSNNYTNTICLVGYDGSLGDQYYYLERIGVRPLVSIPMSNVRIENGIVTIEK